MLAIQFDDDCGMVLNRIDEVVEEEKYYTDRGFIILKVNPNEYPTRNDRGGILCYDIKTNKLYYVGDNEEDINFRPQPTINDLFNEINKLKESNIELTYMISQLFEPIYKHTGK